MSPQTLYPEQSNINTRSRHPAQDDVILAYHLMAPGSISRISKYFSKEISLLPGLIDVTAEYSEQWLDNVDGTPSEL